MRRSIIAVAVAMLLLPAAAEARAILPAERAPSAKGCPVEYTIRDFRRYASKVYRRDRVSARAHRRLRTMRSCGRHPYARRWIRRWHRRYVREREARRRAAAVTPYGNWAIPAIIVWCESRYQNAPPNSAGASGYYQDMPSTWAGYGGATAHAYQASKAEQDRVNARIWAGGRGAHHWNASRHCWGGRL